MGGGITPEIEFIEPTDGEAVISRVGYDMLIRVVDDRTLRDRPLLFYTDGHLEQRDQIDLETLRFAEFRPEPELGDDVWTAFIPTFRLTDDEPKTIALVPFVQDDDPIGTRCDNTAELRIGRFTAVGAGEARLLRFASVISCPETARPARPSKLRSAGAASHLAHASRQIAASACASNGTQWRESYDSAAGLRSWSALGYRSAARMTSNRTTRSRVGPRWPMEPYGSASCASATTTSSLSSTAGLSESRRRRPYRASRSKPISSPEMGK